MSKMMRQTPCIKCGRGLGVYGGNMAVCFNEQCERYRILLMPDWIDGK